MGLTYGQADAISIDSSDFIPLLTDIWLTIKSNLWLGLGFTLLVLIILRFSRKRKGG